MRKIALIGGIGYLIIFVTGMYANFNVLETLRDPNSVLNTLKNLQEGHELFGFGITAFVIMLIADLIVTGMLYKLFDQTDKKRNAIAAMFRLINVVFFAIALFHLFQVNDLLQVNTVPQINELDYALAINKELLKFDMFWLVGLIFFGIHLILLSKVLCNAKVVHKSISALLFIAGVGYIVDSCLQLFYWDYASISHIATFIVVLPGLIGELALTFWLLLKGGRMKPAVC